MDGIMYGTRTYLPVAKGHSIRARRIFFCGEKEYIFSICIVYPTHGAFAAFTRGKAREIMRALRGFLQHGGINMNTHVRTILSIPMADIRKNQSHYKYTI